jgi:hypothetical protein
MLCVRRQVSIRRNFFIFSRIGTRAFLVLPGEDGLKSSGIPTVEILIAAQASYYLLQVSGSFLFRVPDRELHQCFYSYQNIAAMQLQLHPAFAALCSRFVDINERGF